MHSNLMATSSPVEMFVPNVTKKNNNKLWNSLVGQQQLMGGQLLNNSIIIIIIVIMQEQMYGDGMGWKYFVIIDRILLRILK